MKGRAGRGEGEWVGELIGGRKEGTKEEVEDGVGM